MMMLNSVRIPVVDFEAFINGDLSDQMTVSKQIYQACHEIGFVYLTNAGISQTLVDQMFAQSNRLFKLPYPFKTELSRARQITPDLTMGYVRLEQESADPGTPGDLKETFDVFKSGCFLEAAFDARTAVSEAMKAELEAEAFCSAASHFFATCSRTASYIFRSFAMGLSLPVTFFEERHQRNMNLRLLHYPPIHQEPEPHQVRCGEHADFGSLTLLFQDATGGLEVCTAEGQWIAAPPMPNAVLVNVGDLMQRWTNRQLRSTRHRVAIPQNDKKDRSRYSIAFFCDPDLDVMVNCLDSCHDGDRPPVYPPVLAGDYLAHRLREVIYPLPGR
ncbi:MAG: isopenicillin N synthase family dioxygenase [Elainellaceae cyanobacterium]